MRVKFQIVFFEVLKHSFSSQNLTNLNQLISIAVSHKEGLFFENLFLVNNLPLMRTWRLLTKRQVNSRSNCNRPEVMGPWNTLMQLSHCSPVPCDKTRPVPNRWASVFASLGLRWYSGAWHLCAWFPLSDRNRAPSLNKNYFQKFIEIKSNLHISHIWNQGSEIDILQMIKDLN